jgi:hypothetical protein
MTGTSLVLSAGLFTACDEALASMRYKCEFLGELIGTFLLVLFGCGSVAVSVLFNAHQGLFQVAMVWESA